jgi:hypothetical protein
MAEPAYQLSMTRGRGRAKGGVGCLSLQDPPRIMVSSHSTEAERVPGFNLRELVLTRLIDKPLKAGYS